MPEKKDLKRLTRTRMEKTGESYTTARARLLEKRARAEAEPEEDLAARAGMSDAAVLDATGRDWRGWVRALDSIDAASRPHAEIARHVHDEHGVSGWWAQTVTVGYERIRGLRAIGQRSSGVWEANKSKTVPVPIGRLYRAFADEAIRRDWLGELELVVRKATPEKSMRISWPDGTSVAIYFWVKGDAKSQVSLQHTGLASQEAADEMKSFWAERFAALAARLAPS